MVKSEPHTPRKFIVPLYMNGLRGRMLRMPSTTGRSKNEILIVYGQRSSIEKWFPLAEELSKYGSVTIPDLPGFGGMQPFYKLSIKPTVDNYADYLAAFIKLKYRHKRLSIVGLSFGFVVVTRMLQKYPELSKKINMLVDVAGFMHHEELKLNNQAKLKMKVYTRTLTVNPPLSIYGAILLRPHLYNRISKRMRTIQQKSNLDQKEFKTKHASDLKLRRKNHVKTHMFTLRELVSLDNIKMPVDLPVWNITGLHEEHLQKEKTTEYLEKVYKKVNTVKLKSPKPDPFMLYSADEIDAMMPKRIKSALNKLYEST
jgi:pimeloyl-ACP methyl ester carboxylesterase